MNNQCKTVTKLITDSLHLTCINTTSYNFLPQCVDITNTKVKVHKDTAFKELKVFSKGKKFSIVLSFIKFINVSTLKY